MKSVKIRVITGKNSPHPIRNFTFWVLGDLVEKTTLNGLRRMSLARVPKTTREGACGPLGFTPDPRR